MMHWTGEHLAFIRSAYLEMTEGGIPAVFYKQFGVRVSHQQLRATLRRYRITCGRGPGAGLFKPGHTPANKGIKGWDAGGRSHETQFKPGRKPQTWVPVGTEVTDSDGYRKIKVSDDDIPSRFNWRFVHRLVWEKVNGTIPKGTAIVFVDGDRSNCEIDNLVLLTRSELARLNQKFAGLERDVDLRVAAINAAKLAAKLHQRETGRPT